MDKDKSLYDLLDDAVSKDWWEQAALADNKNTPSHIRRRIIPFGTRYWVVAASVALLIGVGLTVWSLLNTGTIEYHTNYGERQQIELPDGSIVELNANSRLSWNKSWNRTGVRSVDLDGEAYFDVVKMAGKEFQVTADETLVKVLGTSFNVSNRRGKTEVFLHEGQVKLEIPDQEPLTMVPGEKVAYKGKSSMITKTKEETLRSAAAWKTGVISFRKVALKDIIPELNDIYGIRLVCPNPQLEEKIMDVGVPYMDWDATKTSLELAMNVAITESDGEYIIELKE
ncbi:MAG TPA: FecR domain-containing protein [Membranihabitans sp.]|nr:FecR domain-containing protein [Membranihabitans sp.]